MQTLKITTIVVLALFAFATAKSQDTPKPEAGLQHVDVMPVSPFPSPHGTTSGNAVDVLLVLFNAKLAGKAEVTVLDKNDRSLIAQQTLTFFEKEGANYYAIGKRERRLKRGSALVNFEIGQRLWEDVTVETVLYDQLGVKVDSKTM